MVTVKRLFGSPVVVEKGEFEGLNTRVPKDELPDGGEKL